MESLAKEWQLRRSQLRGWEIVSVYFGGGTPALLDPRDLQEILRWVRQDCQLSSDTEITLEANPENVSLERFRRFAELGVNRVSLGIQTLDNALLRRLERQHDAQRCLDAVNVLPEAGIENLSVDLIYDLPQQSLESWVTTVDQVAPLPITHLSLYNLVIEPRSTFFKYRKSVEAEMPPGELSLAMLDYVLEVLPCHGLERYEISAFAKSGFWSRHNTGYWQGRPFLGLGPSAFSYWGQRRFRNVEHLGRYQRAVEGGELPVDYNEELDPQARQREQLCIALRLVEGVELASLGELDASLESDLERVTAEGWLEQGEGRICLTEKGRRFYDTVASELI